MAFMGIHDLFAPYQRAIATWTVVVALLFVLNDLLSVSSFGLQSPLVFGIKFGYLVVIGLALVVAWFWTDVI